MQNRSFIRLRTTLFALSQKIWMKREEPHKYRINKYTISMRFSVYQLLPAHSVLECTQDRLDAPALIHDFSVGPGFMSDQIEDHQIHNDHKTDEHAG